MIYLDYGATSPLRTEALEAMQPFLQNQFGNPSSLHDFGQNSHDAIQIARNQIAQAIHADSAREIIFTSSGTEANNLAILGAARKRKHKGNHIITTQIEHPSVLEACRSLEQEGYRVTYLPVDSKGVVSLTALEQAITPQTILISVMAANNEVGTIQPISDIATLIKGKSILFHSDAVQLIGKVPFSLLEIPVDLLSLGSHKIYGPKGAGALYIRKGVRLEPQLHGGGQERGYRSSTLNTPAIVGFGLAAHLITQEVEKEQQRLTKLRNTLWNRISTEIGDVQFHGHPTQRLPSNLNLSFQGIEGQAIMLELNREQIYISSGSACSAGKHQASHVLIAMGKGEEIAQQSLRITLGKETTENDIHTLMEKLITITQYFRSMMPTKF